MTVDDRTMRLLKLLKHRPPNFSGETIGVEDDATADDLVVKGNAVEVDADGNVIATKETMVPTIDASLLPAIGDGATEWKFDPKTDPFVTDGISKQAAQALHDHGLHSVAAVRQFMADLAEGVSPVDAVNEIEGVTDAQAEKIVKLYGLVTEFSEE